MASNEASSHPRSSAAMPMRRLMCHGCLGRCQRQPRRCVIAPWRGTHLATTWWATTSIWLRSSNEPTTWPLPTGNGAATSSVADSGLDHSNGDILGGAVNKGYGGEEHELCG